MSVRVVARVRPLLKTELDRDTVVTAHSQPSDSDDAPPTLVRIPNPRNEGENFTFQFNRVFQAETTQKELFEAEIKPTVKHLFSGHDVTLFAYGVTGTGKTHTMRGGKSMEDRGIIPRLLSSIYRKAKTQSKGTAQVSISMSYYEIYNDKVFDLFEPPEKRTFAGLPLRDNGSRTVVVGLTERACEDLKSFEKLYDQANMNRSTSATKLNAHSSRSHAILCVKVSTTTGDKTVISTASCIDLAGSEDNRRTDNKKERLIESSAINKSLFVLGQCVEAIGKGQHRIPYRESKMTRILSLGQNNGLCICLLNLAPIRSYHLDTLSSLNFANRTKKIEIREAENEPIFIGGGKVATSGPALTARRAPLAARQPLRNISTTLHNVTAKKAGDAAAVTKAEEKPSKPVKAFTVFSDNPQPEKRKSWAKRGSPQKRDSGNFTSALPKVPRKSPRSAKRTSAAANPISQAAIEELVEKKVTEMLAARVMDAPAVPQRDISDDVKRRLEVLEQKIEATASDDERAEGLSYLLMAKQHLARGEEVSALKMYQLAKQYFPENTKLENKMKRLREKIEAKKLTIMHVGKENIPPELGEDVFCGDDDDAEYTEDRDWGYGDENGDDGSYSPSRPAAKKRKRTKVMVRPFSENLGGLSPRGRRLLDIINTRDILQIRALKGVGARKADSIVDALQDKQDLDSLQDLAELKGVGLRTVENMRFGLTV